MTLDVHQFASLLGRPVVDGKLSAFLRQLGEQPELDCPEYHGFLDYPGHGLCLVFHPHDADGQRVRAAEPEAYVLVGVHLYAEGYEAHRRYGGPICDGIQPGDHRREVLRKLGNPDGSGGGTYSERFGCVLQRWDRYEFGSYQVQFQYDDSTGCISLVTVSMPPSRPAVDRDDP